MPNTSQVEDIRNRYDAVLEKVVLAAESVGRTAADIKVVVVSKTHPLSLLEDAYNAGIRVFGENYAEEAAQKIQSLPADIEWHMIGHVQSRKADLVAQNFDFMHSLDSLKLAQRLNRFAAEAGRVLPVLLECNVSGEESKFGYAAWDEAHWPALAAEAAQIAELPHLEICGLMTMPPLFEQAEVTRPFFRRLCEVRENLVKRVPRERWDELSMGTSADFTAAVAEGATLVRVGTAILGARPPKG